MPAKPKPAPRQARAYPTLKAWIGSDENKEWLKSLLTDPRFLALLHYTKDIHRVTVDDLCGRTAMLNECVIRKAAVHAGAVAFEETLRGLLIEGSNFVEPEAWAHINPITGGAPSAPAPEGPKNKLEPVDP